MRVDAATEAQLRQSIVDEAHTWIDTPFHSRTAVKGAGVECGWLAYGVLRDLKLLPPSYEMPEYSIQFWAHRDDEIYIEGVLKAGFHEIPGPPLPGDIILVKYGRVYGHGGIVVDWPWVIHTHSYAEKVIKAHADRDRLLQRMNHRKFFSLFETIGTDGTDI